MAHPWKPCIPSRVCPGVSVVLLLNNVSERPQTPNLAVSCLLISRRRSPSFRLATLRGRFLSSTFIFFLLRLSFLFLVSVFFSWPRFAAKRRSLLGTRSRRSRLRTPNGRSANFALLLHFTLFHICSILLPAAALSPSMVSASIYEPPL